MTVATDTRTTLGRRVSGSHVPLRVHPSDAPDESFAALGRRV